jgi:voltage-gated sodium channel
MAFRYIGMLWFLLIYIYAIAGVDCFGGNDPVHFGDLHTSMLTFFGVSTFDGLGELMYTNMYGCDRYGYADSPDLCLNPSAKPFLAIFIFTTYCTASALVLLSIFLGVVSISMEQAAEEHAKNQMISEYIEDLMKQHPEKIDTINKLVVAFHHLDDDKRGTLESNELHFAVKCAGFEGENLEIRIQQSLKEMDDNHDGAPGPHTPNHLRSLTPPSSSLSNFLLNRSRRHGRVYPGIGKHRLHLSRISVHPHLSLRPALYTTPSCPPYSPLTPNPYLPTSLWQYMVEDVAGVDFDGVMGGDSGPQLDLQAGMKGFRRGMSYGKGGIVRGMHVGTEGIVRGMNVGTEGIVRGMHVGTEGIVRGMHVGRDALSSHAPNMTALSAKERRARAKVANRTR